MAKVPVKGEDKTPLYQYLTDKSANPKTGGEIQWNVTKFLVGRDGRIITRFEPAVTPDSPEVTGAIEKALGEAVEKCGSGVLHVFVAQHGCCATII